MIMLVSIQCLVFLIRGDGSQEGCINKEAETAV